MRYALLTFIGFLYVACSDRVTNDHGSSDPELMEIVTVSGTGIPGFSGDGGLAELAELNIPIDVLVRPTGELVIVDFGNHRVRTINLEAGIITTLAGTGEPIGEGALNLPTSIIWEHDDYYVTSWAAHKVFKYNASGVRMLVAGTGEENCDNNSISQDATMISLSWPRSIGLLSNGAVVIAEQGCQRLWEMSPRDQMQVFAGTGVAGYDGDDGQALDAIFGATGPHDSADVVPGFGFGVSPEDPPDEIYIAATANHVIREINLFSGSIETFAGTGEKGFADGSPKLATFNRPTAVFVAEDHSVWIVDSGNNAIRRIDPLKIEVSTVVGTGEAGFNGDGIPARDAQLNQPGGVHVTDDGVLYIADSGNHRVRKMSLPGYQRISHHNH